MKIIRKFMTVMVLYIFILGLTNIGTLKVQAASPTIEKNLNYYLYGNRATSTNFVYIKNPVNNGKITNLKNSNSQVVEVTAMNPYGILRICPKKEGTSKISFRYAGKTFSRTVTVERYENPCQSFKVGNTNYTKYFNKSRHFNHNKRKKDVTGTISIKPKKGWKLEKIEVYNMSIGRKAVKNNSKITMSINWTGTGVDAYFKNIKTGRMQKLTLGYSGQQTANMNLYD